MSGEEQTKDVINIDMDYFDNVVTENAGDYSFQRVDNFLPEDMFRDLQSLLLNGNQHQIMPWYYRAGMSDYEDTEGYLFGNDIIDRGVIPDNKLFLEIAMPIVSRLPMRQLIRMKINCHPRQTLRGSPNYPPSRFHTDMKGEHTVAILSINTCNGYTEFEDGTQIESIENSLVIFNGGIKHRSMGQTDSNIRVNININFIE